MPDRYQVVGILILGLAAVGGCSHFAVRTPTPAAEIDPSALWEPRPGERFFVTLFGSQTFPNIPRRTHTWGTVIRVVETGEGQPRQVEEHTISWLPATLEIHPWDFHTEAGVNLGLHETLRFVLKKGAMVIQWGPYECRPDVYYRFMVQKAFLESGRVGYQANDSIGEAARTGNGCDCIHALTDMDPRMSRNHYPLIRIGHSATRFIAREIRLRGVLINPDQTHDWLNPVLGLDNYPITPER